MPQAHAPLGPKQRKALDPAKPRGKGGCAAHRRKSQYLCNGKAIAGADVCRMHGGSAPQVKQAAMERLRALQHPAVDALAWLIEQRDFPSAAMAAAKDVLDRTEGKAAESVNMNVTGDEKLIASLMAGRKRAASAKAGE